jgi:hypothetical protein
LQDEEGGIAFTECPNLLCDRMVAYVPDPQDPTCQVFCGSCKVELIIPNPYFVEPTSEDEEAQP